MSQSHPVSKDYTGDAKSPAPTTSARRGLIASRLVMAVCFVVLIGFGVFLLQRILVPDVDAEKTQPVVVGTNSAGPDSVNPDPESANLPEGAVTAAISQQVIDQADHPFRPLVKVAELCVKGIDDNIQDYSATLVSQVLVDEKLQDEKYLEIKIRHASIGEGTQVPFSVYTKFLKPKANVGQEAIWVEGQNEDNLVAHATGLLNVKRVFLDPDGAMAMKGNLHPIRDIGFRNLIIQISETAVEDLQHGECSVTIKRDVDINGRSCSLLEAVHPVKRDHFDFHIARIYIDDHLNIPVAYEGYFWPEKEGGQPQLFEKYYYTDIKLNIGLTDADFDPGNEAYNYPSW